VRRSPRIFLVLGVAGLLGLAACGSSKPSTTSQVSSQPSTASQVRCNRSTADSLIRQLPLQSSPSQFLSSDQVLCIDLTGSGRQDLVAAVWDAMDHGAHYWAAWRNEGSRWVRIALSGDCCQMAPHKFGMGIGVTRSSTKGQFLVSQPISASGAGTKVARWAWKQGTLEIVGHS
jgi:hypothetical protein